MSKFYFENLSPGILSALLFVIMDILIIGLLDVVLTRVVCILYFRNVNNGQPIVVKSADVPGLTHFLIGTPWSLVNMGAILCKISLLAIIFVGNIDIGDNTQRPVSRMRNATFVLRPNDDVLSDPKRDYAVRRRFDRSKFCVNRYNHNATLDYYPIRFNLANGMHLKQDVVFNVTDTNVKRYDVDDASVVCMSPTETENEMKLQRVWGCTRIAETDHPTRCKSVVSHQINKSFDYDALSIEARLNGRLVSQIFKYSAENVSTLFSDDYPTLEKRLTCFSTNLHDVKQADLRYMHCLLVAFNKTTATSFQTIIERWVLEVDRGERFFVLPYRGVIFDGIFNITEAAAEAYLENLFLESDYESMSGDLIAVSSIYRAFTTDQQRQFIQYDTRGESQAAFATISKTVVGLLAAATAVIFLAFVVTTLLLRFDKRPRFNTIDGLSSIVREEYAPSGQSYKDEGKKAILGLRFTKDDKMHFGPIANYDEAEKLQDGYDVF